MCHSPRFVRLPSGAYLNLDQTHVVASHPQLVGHGLVMPGAGALIPGDLAALDAYLRERVLADLSKDKGQETPE